MQQLPAKTSPKWLALTAQGIAAVVLFAMTASLLPVLLITSLVGALVLIPVLRQLCKEVEQTARPKKTPISEEMIDITPFHQRWW
jgi:UPF0716 family protein affecting phage T7 exclusion